ncbi:serine hydrolase domain-containing protein [Microbacterium stercoris]|uniref:Beta-lactamase family protein n=1 Tax=Microbacterium stercoris TaxID=2820289 RepID=A0A939QHD2_9MICO|nr:serine hydrolase domain-containing protein [Microbacterium stercoris]MBO3662694.1 beta-lactamase family protein [Microbacterium stercoris]
MTIELNGYVHPDYENVAEVFQKTARETGGSALSIRVEGETVMDLWQGTADEESGRPWTSDTPVVVFSATKGLVAILVAQLVEEGLLELDAPVARYWPEFARAGKEAVTVRQLLAHRAGLAAPVVDIDLDTALDWDAVTGLLAAQEPLWQPGTAYGYHALTYGWLAGELVRRLTGRSVGEALQDRIAGPLHADAWIGLPESREGDVARLHAGRSLLVPPPSGAPGPSGEDARWISRAMTLGAAFPAELVVRGRGFDDPQVHRAEVPGAGGIATARALAAIWSATVVETEGVRLLNPAVIADMTEVQSEGQPVWWLPGPYPRWGTGFMLTSDVREFLSAHSFGHDGAGGQVAFADSEARVGFGYITNHFEVAQDERGTELVRALRRALA